MYPSNCIQSLLGSEWWKKNDGNNYPKGQLIKAYVPHVEQIPSELNLIGRTEPTKHDTANYEVAPLRIKQKTKAPVIPVSGLQLRKGERHAIYTAKVRPLLVIHPGYGEIPPELRRAGARWQTAPTILAAPFYGVENTDGRAGWVPEFIERIKNCEYPHYLWDILPNDDGVESIPRLDHIMPIGKHHDSIEITPFCLSEDALIILDEWLKWFFHDELDGDETILAGMRKTLIEQ